MGKWEYKRVVIQWGQAVGSSNTRTKWFANTAEGEVLEGFDNVLSYFGEQGWEAVNVTPSVFEELSPASNIGAKKVYEASSFTAIFKRQINNE